MPKNIFKHLSNFSKPLIGDWLIILASIVGIIFLFQTIWTNQPAAKLRITLGNQIVGTYNLNQHKTLNIMGKIGLSTVIINQGKARFKQSPCSNQYCVHQGWLSKAGQVAVCLPNQISLELLGEKKFDTLNY